MDRKPQKEDRPATKGREWAAIREGTLFPLSDLPLPWLPGEGALMVLPFPLSVMVLLFPPSVNLDTWNFVASLQKILASPGQRQVEKPGQGAQEPASSLHIQKMALFTRDVSNKQETGL